ncbi:MAG: sigma-70 family RNA polymerase sigma factor [Planctomycetota bacterium]|nr:sigma-70 family RNA polymerase sigma factor [Planctomycetota bacterium]
MSPAEPEPPVGAAQPSDHDPVSDHELIRRAQAGEERAFELLVQRHQDRAFRVARNLVGHREDAADLAQEAFVRIFRSLERFDFEHEFPTWLYRIVTNLGIDHLRRRRPLMSTAGAAPGEDDEPDFDLVDEDADQPSDAVERRETAVRVRACIDALAPHFRVVMALRELEGLPCTEIARIVGATHVTVRWRLHRGRKLFLEEWERRERNAGRPGTATNTPTDPSVPSDATGEGDLPSPGA